MTLVDTSIWIDHLRKGNPKLADLLDAGHVLMHPFILGELACGHLTNRKDVLTLLGDLPMAPTATEKEALDFIERYTLMGRGIGYMDVHMLAATALEGTAKLWTYDKRLAGVACELSLA